MRLNYNISIYQLSCIKNKAKPYSRSHHYAQLGNALQKHFYAYSALVMGTLPADFLISVPKVKILRGVRMDLICPNLSIRSKINVNKKSWYTPHLKDNLILIIFYLGGLGSIFAVMCRQSYRWRHSWKNYIFPVKTIEIFARIVPAKLNYESIVDRGGSKGQSFLKMTPDKTSEAAPRSVLWKRC